MNNPKAHSSLLMMVGFYLLYLTYEMVKNQLAGEAGMPDWLSWVFIVLFALLGVGIIAFSGKIWFDADKRAKAQKEKNSDDDPTQAR